MTRLVMLFVILEVVAGWSSCSKFMDIYTSGEELCEKMWGDSFEYERDEDFGYTMWWFDKVNPNNKVAQLLGMDPAPDTCKLQYFHKSEGQEPGGYSTGVYTAPSPEDDTFTECHPWQDSSCCHEAVVETPKAINEAYGDGYHWDRCDGWVEGYKMSDACARFFVQEACMYECSPHAGQYRRYTDAEAAAFAAFSEVDGNPGDPYGMYEADDPIYAGTFTHDGKTYDKSLFFGNGVYGPNQWQMYKMPIKASFCDAFYTACAHDYFCGTGDFWSCSADYRANEITRVLEGYPPEIQAIVNSTEGITPEAAVTMADELVAEQEARDQMEQASEEALEKAVQEERKDKDEAVKEAEGKLPAWAWVLIGALIVVVLLIIGFVCYIRNTEKKTGKPLFVNLESKSSGVEATSNVA